jgi:hypothetical protein
MMQIAIYESLLASPFRTTNADEADFFYVPAFGACLITRADDTPHLSMKVFSSRTVPNQSSFFLIL